MNFTKEECDKWIGNKTVNPRTNKKLKPDGPTYKKLESTCSISDDKCKEWRKNPHIHPITMRKLNMKAKNGMYAQMVKLCGTQDSDGKTPRTNLIKAMQKVLGPVLNKGDTMESRKLFANILRKQISTVKPCLEIINKQLCLVDAKKKPVVIFSKQIGSKSVYGTAYMNAGVGFAKLLKFSCKIMDISTYGHKQEVELLDKMSKLAINGNCPNMPITYKGLKCTKKCINTSCPEGIKNKTYYVVINELATYDIQNWFREKHDDAAYESILMQIVFSLYAFHTLGYIHNDAHLGNFLVHKITPGGYWRYQVGHTNVYVPNRGYLLVLWDPGLAMKSTQHCIDYDRCFGLIAYMKSYKKYKDLKCIQIPDKINYGALAPLNDILCTPKMKEIDALKLALDKIKDKTIKFNHIMVDQVPDDFLLNIKPYKCL